MFKNQNVFGDANQVVQHQDFSQDKDLKIENIPIYTMAKDLEEIEHPEIKKAYAAQKEAADKLAKNAGLSEKQKTSPFLEMQTESPTPIVAAVPQVKAPKKSFWGSLFGAQTEAEKIAKQKKLEEKRMAEQKAADEKRRAAQRIEEQKRMEEKRLAEQKAAAQLMAEMKKTAEIERAENEKLLAQKEAAQKAEEQRMLEMQKAAEIKRVEEQKAEERRLAEVKRIEEQKIAALKKQAEIEEQKIAKLKKTALNSSHPQNSATLTRILTTLTITFIIIILGAGAYYLITARPGITPVPEPQTVTPEPEVAITPEPEVVTEPTFSVGKPNYLTIDIATADAAKIQESINRYVADVKKSAITTPVEFIITDIQNNPIDFATFSQKINLNLSPSVSKNLNKNFSLFMFNDNGNLRLGLAIDAVDVPRLKAALLKEEPVLAKNMASILLSTDFTLPTTIFGKSDYQGIAVRYQNIVSPENLSIDYALTDKQLLIGTTKLTLRAILDRKISDANIISCKDEFYTKFSSCTPAKCIYEIPALKLASIREVIGMENGKCYTTLTMPNNGIQACKLTTDQQVSLAKYLRDTDTALISGTDVAFSTSGDIAAPTSTYTINGKTSINPIQEMFNKQDCTVSFNGKTVPQTMSTN